ncbi:MAG: sugar ABC transporter ATP-binding protein [Anaerolineales bacterium]|nr:sugar ABC transporter ATP-binding protein [Anaerolineales bacterium]
MSENKNELILEVDGISKRFGGVQALKDVNFNLKYGEVHALVGENGAGKTTLINVLGGIVQRDSGRIIYQGEEVHFELPRQAIEAGTAIIHQELAMMPQLNVIENVYMGRMPTKNGRINWNKAEEDTRQMLDQVGLNINPRILVGNLTISQRQLLEIAKALSMNATLLIMDEPNSSLSESESEILFEVIKRLKERNVAILYVSHKIEEVLHIADRVSVLRDGQYRGTMLKEDASVDKIIHMMVGRDLLSAVTREDRSVGKVRLVVKELSSPSFNNINFTIHEGEIVGFAGLVGSGRSNVARAIFGDEPYDRGEILLDGKPVRFRHPSDAINNGIGMIQEDRKELSLFMGLSIQFNMSVVKLPELSRGGVIKRAEVKQNSDNYIDQLSIKLNSVNDPVSSLSGGNQQKITLARWLAIDPKLLIMDEPTHGVDVGAKADIYELMRDLAEQGISIMLISSELPEIMTMSDRVVVMHEGEVTAILEQAECDEETIMIYATGIGNNNK